MAEVADQTFLHYTCVASQDFVSQEYEMQGHDEDHLLNIEGEGLLDATPKGRSANYTTKEENLLCEASKKKVFDPVICVEQAMFTYWDRNYDHLWYVAQHLVGKCSRAEEIKHIERQNIH